MKRLLITLTVITLSASCFAQGKEGHLSIIPRIGVDLAKITNGEYFVAESNSDFKVDANIRPAFACGIDAEYMLNSHFALNAGVYYTQQGAKTIALRMKTRQAMACITTYSSSTTSACRSWRESLSPITSLCPSACSRACW